MNNKYLIVNKEILPNYYEKVIEAKNLLKDGQYTNVSEVVKLVGISRSTYYKYKDYIFLPNETQIGKKALISLILKDIKGALSEIINIIYTYNCNILTINQNIPINSIASVIVLIDILDSKIDIEELVNKLKNTKITVSAKLIEVE